MQTMEDIRDAMQDDTDTGFLAYVMAHMEEFKIVQVVNAFK